MMDDLVDLNFSYPSTRGFCFINRVDCVGWFGAMYLLLIVSSHIIDETLNSKGSFSECEKCFQVQSIDECA